MRKLVLAILNNPLMVYALTMAIVALGMYSYSQLDIEAYPNPVAPMIEVITQPEGWSSEEVERYVTVPIENALSGMLDLDHIRSQSLFGLSDVKVYFDWDPTYYEAQQRVLNRLTSLSLPNGLTPNLSPWSAIGEIFRYQLVGKGYSSMELNTAQNWIMEKQFRQARGVVDVVSFGGQTQQYHVEVNPYRLRSHNIRLDTLLNDITNANQNVGGGRMTLGEQSFDVRGTGLVRSVHDIEDIEVAELGGTAVRVRDVANVKVDAAPRMGMVGKDTDPDIVQGTVLMRYGGDSLKTLKAVHERVQFIRTNRVLPPGMDLQPYYDRADLVSHTTHTVIENLITGMLLVTLVLWAFLGHTRAALVTALNIPLALMIAFTGMVSTNTPANLISLGAVDFGIVVDSTVIMMENIFRHLVGSKAGERLQRIADAAGEVGTPMFFSTLIIAVAFVPLFTMTGVAGIIFSPMAHTYAFAIGGAIVMAICLTPVLAARFIHLPEGAHGEEEHSNALMRALDRFYRPIFAFALAQKKKALIVGAVPVVLLLSLAPLLGQEFMPKLEEGNFWIRATLPLSVAPEQSMKYVNRMREILLGCDSQAGKPCDDERRENVEIATVISQLGRPDDGTDPAGFSNIEFFAPMRPKDKWRTGMTKEKLTEQLSREMHDVFPGVVFNFSQMIADNVEEAMSGVKGENTVKVFGPNITIDEDIAEKIESIMARVPGIADLGIFRSLGQPNIRVTPDRRECGRYGLNVGDVEAVLHAAVGGQVVSEVYQGETHFDLVVRLAAEFRGDIAALRKIPISTPDGAVIPLGQLAQVVQEEGPAIVYREDIQRYVPVKFSVRGRDLASTIDDVQERIRKEVKLPYDVHLEWSGEMNQLNEAATRLMFIIPITLLLITFLVHTTVRNWTDTLIALVGIPVACSGGILGLLVTNTNFSISAAMGFISIFGIAIQDSLIVVTYAQRLRQQGHNIEESARLAAERRLRPVLMTTCVAMLGLFPAALSTGIGSETQKPLAIVVIGGAVILAILPRLLQPALLTMFHKEVTPA